MSNGSYNRPGANASRSEIAEQRIRDYIVSNNLKAGDALPPTSAFVNQFGISRNSVREAIKALDAVGLVVSRPGTGLFVGDLSPKPLFDQLSFGISRDFARIAELLELRFYLDYGMVDSLVRNRTPEQITAARSTLAMMAFEAERGRYSLQADRAFHEALHATNTNPMIRDIASLFWDVVAAVSGDARDVMAAERPAPEDTMLRHVAIVEALEAGDANNLRVAIIQHYVAVEVPFGLPALADAYRQVARHVSGDGA